MRERLRNLSREKLQKIILEMLDFLTEEQHCKLNAVIDGCVEEDQNIEKVPRAVRMSQELVEEKMKRLEGIMQQIDEGDLYLNTDGYENYSAGYWDSEWIVDYYDNQGIGEKIEAAVQFAKECVDDGWYQEAGTVYDWLWGVYVSTDEEDGEGVDLEQLLEEKIIHVDLQQLALLTLYVDYQALEPEERAADMYSYFTHSSFQGLHMEDVFHAGRENLTETDRFWNDWIMLLKTKSGETAGRLFKEAILYREGVEGLVNAADENCRIHPSLYLAAMSEYERVHNYAKMEELGEKAMEKIDSGLVIRSETALKAAYASSCLMHGEKVSRFCWESFRSDSTERNFLRLFGRKEMAEQYGMRGREVLHGRMREKAGRYTEDVEMRRNVMDDNTYFALSFYTGDFKTAKEASVDPDGSLGWSAGFIHKGVRLFLLYLYEDPLPSKAAAAVANRIGFFTKEDACHAMSFEAEIAEESRNNGTSIFWGFFQRWKPWFPMTEEEKTAYLTWVEKIIHSRAQAIVDGQHRTQYEEVASLLAILAEIKESRGVQGAKQEIFGEYKSKYPRHSSFQKEMRACFGV